MPVEFREGKTPKGHDVLISRSSGSVIAEEAQRLVDAVAAGGSHAGWAVHSTIEKGTQYTPDARRVFTAGGSYSCCAVVVSNPIVKTIIGFIMKVTGRDERAKMFDSDQAAMNWIDETLAKQASVRSTLQPK